MLMLQLLMCMPTAQHMQMFLFAFAQHKHMHMPPPPPAGPALYPGPPPGFTVPVVPSLPPSAPRHTTNVSSLQPSAPRYTTTAAAATWHARAAAAREARRTVYSRSSVRAQPTAEQTALAERFRLIAAANPQGLASPTTAVAQPLILLHPLPIQGTPTAAAVAPDVSLEDSFYSAILQNKSIIDSDFKDMGSLVDLSQPPLTPATYTNIKIASTFANQPNPVQASQYNPPPLPPPHRTALG